MIDRMIKRIVEWLTIVVSGVILTILFFGLGWIIGMWITGAYWFATGFGAITALLFAFGALEADAHDKKQTKLENKTRRVKGA